MTNVLEPADSERAAEQGRTRTTIAGRMRWSVPLGILFALIGGYSVVATYTPRFRASVVLSANPSGFVQAEQALISGVLADREKELVVSETVLDPVLADPAIERSPTLSNAELAAKTLRQNVSVARGSSDHTMLIHFNDTDRQSASDVCNLIADVYLARRSELDRRRESQLSSWIEPQVEHYKRKVEELEKRVVGIAREQPAAYVGSTLGPTLRDIQSDRAMHLQRKIEDVEVDLAVLKAVELEPVELEPVNADSSAIGQNDETAATTAEGAAERDDTVELSRTAQKIHRLEVSHAILSERYAAVHRELTTMSGMNAQLQFAQADLDRARDVLHKLVDRLDAIRTESLRDTSVVAVSRATPPDAPIEDIPTGKAALFAGIGFLIPTLLGCCWPRRRTDAGQADQ
ncbi:hypothetical protein [Planctomycetes bacterium TBK1r]|uniref:Chain length determinant protein n=1 Tax=Stieleria magnilauensis TaxID=2527963 RepID=A0ABX5XH32_9BACT|nr:hypothetical protein TBK1r_02150 [Planctomycetes bacterium TBK1r]